MLQVHINDIVIENVKVMDPAAYFAPLDDLQLEEERGLAEMSVFYKYPTLVAEGQCIEAEYYPLVLVLEDEQVWQPPRYKSANDGHRHTLLTNDGSSALEMDFDADDMRTAVTMTLADPSDKVRRLFVHISKEIAAAMRRHGKLGYANQYKHPWSASKSALRAQVKIALVDSLQGRDNETLALVPLSEAANYIDRGRAVWVPEELRVYDTANKKLYGPREDVFTALSQGFRGKALLRFDNFDVTKLEDGVNVVACVASLVTLEGNVHSAQNVIRAPPHHPCAPPATKRRRVRQLAQ